MYSYGVMFEIDGVVYRVTSIGKKAFYRCKSLKNILIKSGDIKNGSIGSKAFKGVNKSVIVRVPNEKYKTYKKMLKKAGIGSKAKIYKTITRG